MVGQLFRTSSHPEGWRGTPDFELKENSLLPAENLPGPGGVAWFELRGVKFYPTANNPGGWSGAPWFEVIGNKVYPTIDHPKGGGGLAWFEIR